MYRTILESHNIGHYRFCLSWSTKLMEDYYQIKLNNFTVSLSQTGYEISSNPTPFEVYDHLHISWTVANTSIFTDDKHTFWFDTYL